MNELTGAGQPISPEQLGHLHGITQQVEKVCRTQLRSYLDAMAPLFRPRRILGNHMEGSGKESVSGADQNLNDLREVFFKACERPFHLRKELPVPLESVPTQLELNEWEYTYNIQSGRDITVVAPLTWVLAYPSAYTHSMVRQFVASKQDRDTEGVRSFVLRASLMHLMFVKLPDLKQLFEGLRYRVEVRRSPLLGDLPFVTLSAPVTTVRPSDELLSRAATLSGRSGFVEVVDPEQAARINDPLQAEISQILESAPTTSTYN